MKKHAILAILFLLLFFGNNSYGQRLQAVHNISDPSLDVVDLYITVQIFTIFLDDIIYRNGLPMTDAPFPDTPINVGIAPGNSTSANDTIRNFVGTLQANVLYAGLAYGVENPALFAPNPDGRDIGIDFTLMPNARTNSTVAGQTQFMFSHGVTDAPTVDLEIRNGASLVNDAAYTDVSSYLTVSAGQHVFDLKDQSGGVIRSFEVDFSTWADSAMVLFLSGFLDPSQNQNGAELGLFGLTPGGDILEFPIVQFSFPPVVSNPIPNQNQNEDFASYTVANLNNVFSDNDTPTLNYSVSTDGNTNATINGTNLTLSSVANYNGSSQVIVSATDGEASASDTFLVTVASVNDPPMLSGIPDQSFAEDGQASTDLDQFVSDADHSDASIGFSATVIAAQANGSPTEISTDDLSVSIDPTTHIATFSPSADSSGIFTVVFTAIDPEEASDTDTVTVTVAAENDPPAVLNPIADQDRQEDFGTFIAANLATVFDDIDSPSLTYDVSTDGNTTAQLFGLNLLIHSVDNVFGSSEVTVTASDGELETSDVFTINLAAVNDAPIVIGAVPDQNLDEDFPTFILADLNEVFNDVDNSNLNFDFTSDTNVAAVLIGSELQLSSVLNLSGNGQITLTASDGQFTAQDIIQVNVAAVNDPPVLSGLADVQFPEDGDAMLELGPSLSDVDNDTADVVLSAEVIAASSGGVPLEIDEDDLSVVINNSSDIAMFSSSMDSSGIFTVVFSATDPEGDSGYDTISVTVEAVNDPPVLIRTIPEQELNEDFDDYVVIDLRTVFRDVDNPNLNLTATTDSNTVATIEGTNLILSSVPNFFGQSQITVTASDGEFSVDESFGAALNPINDPPVLAIDDFELQEDEQDSLALDPFLSDVDNSNAEISLSAEVITAAPLGMPFEIDVTDLTVVIDPLTHIAHFSSSMDSSGVFTVAFTASDPDAAVGHDTISVTLSAVNDPPVVTNPVANQNVDEDFSTFLVVNLYDVFNDVDNAELNFSVSTDSNTTAMIDSANLYLSSVQDVFGTSQVIVSGEDSEYSLTDTFQVAINPVNDPPTLAIDDVELLEDQSDSLALDPFLIDVDNADNEITLTAEVIDAAPVGVPFEIDVSDLTVEINPQTHFAHFSSTMDSSGVFTVVFTATDPDLAETTDTISVTVGPVNDAPVVSNPISDMSIDEDSGVNLVINNLNDVFTDIDSDLGFFASNDGNGITVNIVNDGLAITPDPDYFGANMVIVVADDGEATVSDTFLVTTENVNDAPETFGLLSPPDDYLIPDINLPINFSWEAATDIDNDPLSYTLRVFNAGQDTVVSGITTTSASFDGSLFIQPNAAYRWTVSVADSLTSTASSDTFDMEFLVSAIDNPLSSVPGEFELQQNFPNPFNPATRIRFGVPKAVQVKIEVFNLLGQPMLTLLNEHKSPGYYEIDFDGSNFSSGIYLYKIQAGSFQQIRKMILMK